MDYQYILGGIILLASSLAFVFILYSFGEKKKKKVTESNEYAKTSSENGICSQEVEGETDIIIVGAGVAGAALAYTLGKVYMFVLISSYEFMHLICLYVVI
jgi:squalene monooxygenase